MNGKRLGIFLIFLFFTLSCFAANEPNSYFSPYANCFSVDLSGNTYTYDGAGGGDYQGGDYGEDDMVGIMGVNATNDSDLTYFYIPENHYGLFGGWLSTEYFGRDFKVTVSFPDSPDDPWKYRSVSNPELEIPFGLEFVVRYNTDYKTSGFYGTGQTYKTFSQGYYSDNITNPITKSFDITPDYGLETPGLDERIETVRRWRAFWMDIVLVIPTRVREQLAQSGEIQYGNADDYSVTIKITIEGEDGSASSGSFKKDYIFTLSGYYGDYTEAKSENVVFSVSPSANATSLDLSSMDMSSVVDIGTYYYSTEAYKSHDFSENDFTGYENPFKLFVSSSSDPNYKGEPFRLHLISVPETNTSAAANIPFKIILDSKRSSYEPVEFDGSDYYNVDSKSIGKYLTGFFIAEDSREGDTNSLTFLDEGNIQIQFTGDVTEDYKRNLIEGYYSANIYFHLSSEW